MSMETSEWLNGGNILAGFVSKQGDPWWYDPALMPNREHLYENEVPIEDVHKKLFSWEIVEAQSWAHLPDGRVAQHFGRKMLCRSDTGAVVGEASGKYNPHGYKQWLIHNVGQIIDDSDLRIANAVLLKGGAVAAVQVELAETVEAKAGVKYRPFLLAATSLDSSNPTTYKRCVTNVVCDNTMSAALSEAGQEQKIRHHKNSKLPPLTEVRSTLELVIATGDAFAKEVEELLSIRVTDRIWDKVLELGVPLKDGGSVRSNLDANKKRDRLHELRDSDPRVAPWRNNGWGVMQAFNTWQQWDSRVRPAADGSGNNRFQKNMLATIGGDVDAHDSRTRDILLAAVGK